MVSFGKLFFLGVTSCLCIVAQSSMLSPDNMPTHCDMFLEQCVNHERTWVRGYLLVVGCVCVRVYVHMCVCAWRG